MPYEMKDDEFAIIIKPVGYTEKDGNDWDGDVHTSIVLTKDTTIPNLVAAHIMNIATMMTTFLDVAADYPDIYDIVEERRDELMGLEDDDFEDETETVEYERDGNVLRLSRWSKTEGNA